MMKVVAIVQAHMSSSRLPGKVAKKILGKTMLEHLIDRLNLAKLVDELVIATTFAQVDEKIVEISDSLGVSCFRGSEENVLERLFLAGRWAGSDVVIRVTSDNPLTDPFTIDRMIEAHFRNKMDYTWTSGMPLGTAAEVVSLKALSTAYELAKDPYDLEHVTPFIRRNRDMFKIQILSALPELNRPEIRLTLDYPEDLFFITEIFNCLYKIGEVFPLNQVLELLDNHPELLNINKPVVK
jgi:spore coat polysaccharide biosynthesis protein SpsF